MPLLAIVLVCSLSVPTDRCTEATAETVAMRPASSQLACLTEGQQLAASSLSEGLKGESYVRIDCRRRRPS